MTTETAAPVLYTRRQAAAYLGCSELTLTRWVKRGKIAPVDMGENKHPKYSEKALAAALKRGDLRDKPGYKAGTQRERRSGDKPIGRPRRSGDEVERHTTRVPMADSIEATHRRLLEQERANVPEGYIAGTDCESRYGLHCAKVFREARLGRIARVRTGRCWAYLITDVEECARKAQGEAARREENARAKAQARQRYAYWDGIRFEFDGLTEIKRVVRDLARRSKREIRILRLVPWNNRTIEQIVCTIDPNGKEIVPQDAHEKAETQ